MESSPLIVRLILHSSKQQGEAIIMMKTEDKLIFLYKTVCIFGQTTWLNALMFEAVANAPVLVMANVNLKIPVDLKLHTGTLTFIYINLIYLPNK